MNNGIWEKNLTAMEKWYSEFADMVRKAEAKEDDTQIFSEVSWDGEVIFRIQKAGRMLFLGGRRNAKQPVEMWLERLGEIHKYAPVFLFGIGSGEYLKGLIRQTEENVNVVVYEPSFPIFQKLLSDVDLVEVIENRPIAFIVEGINGEEFEPVMNQVLAVQNMEFLIEEIHPGYQEFYGEQIVGKVRKLHRKVQKIMVDYNSAQLFQGSLAQNIFFNMKYICEGYHTKQLAKAVQGGKTAILVAAGPSLDKNIHELKKAKNRAFILAVDTAVGPLVRNGIMPDTFVTIDPHKDLELIEAPGAEKIPVIAPGTARTALIEHQEGKKIFYFDSYALPAHVYLINGKVMPGASSGGSVACSGFSILFRMGFQTIILVGQDLAYTDNKSHADGTFQEKMPQEDTSGMIMVKGNYQEKVPTLRNLRVYLEWFEMYIAGMKREHDVRVINATEGGAYIEGTELMTLRDAIAQSCQEEMDYSDRIAQMEPDLTDAERKKAVEYLHSVPKQFQEIKEYADQMKFIYHKLEKLSKKRDISEKACRKQLRKIKKLSKKCQEHPPAFQLVDVTMSGAEFVLLSEYYYEEENTAKELQETARKGIVYSDVLGKCAELLKEMAEEPLLSIQ